MSHLIVDLVSDALTEYSYDAELAGLRYNMSPVDDGLEIIVAGYNDKIPVLLIKVLQTLQTFSTDPKRLAVMKEQLSLEYENFKMNQAFRIANYWAKYLITEKAWTKEELLSQVSSK